MMNLVWLRSDLRTFDNPALVAAMNAGPTVALYCLTQKQWDIHGIAPAKRSLIVRHLLTLKDSLAKLNVPLAVLDCDDFSQVPKRVAKFAQQHGVAQVLINDEYELNERRCTEQTQTQLHSLGIQCTVYVDQCLIAPGLVTTKQGDMYKVFSAFKRAFIADYAELGRSCLSQPKPQSQAELTALPKTDVQVLLAAQQSLENQTTFAERWPVGEDYALEQLDAFVSERARDYGEQRDFPAQNGTSILSPYLAIGALSTAQCLQAIEHFNGRTLGDGKDGMSVWMNELLWREFYRHFLFAFPDLCKHKAFKRETEALPWQQDERLLNAWKTGRTGYPLVDAAMRQLNQTGWMHNRLRMVVAMFFTKHLFLDWRLGEAYFMSKLVDGDFASNNGGWQWSASTGVDAVPYFRIFNPTRQSQRFDEDGDFIKHYVPELASLNKKDIHMPSVQQAKALGYPLPIVNHQLAVAETKQHFKNLSLSATDKPTSDLFAPAPSSVSHLEATRA